MTLCQLQIEVKKRRNGNNSNNNGNICNDQQQHNGCPRYPTRFRNRQQQQNQELEKYSREQHHAEIQIANIRKSTTKCQQNEHDYLIYVKDSNSFSTLFHK